MNQPASEIGLGWDINSGGAIYRSVSGVADDVKHLITTNISSANTTTAQGALYPYYSYDTKNYDLSVSKSGLDTGTFTTPDFDSYSINAPSLSGQLKLSYYKFYPYKNTLIAGSNYDFLPNGSSMSIAYRKPQFHFVGDFADTLVSRHYPDTISASTPFNIPTTSLTSLGYTNSKEPFIGKHLQGTTIIDQNFDKATGRLATSNFVEYFRNAEIDSGLVSGMVDFKTTTARSSSIYPPDGIGYFRVTGSNGLTYHYSLPVYQLESTTYRNPLDNDYNPIGAIESDYASSPIAYLPGTSNIIIKNTEVNKYAIKWLLTAITGADYVDANNNRIVDDNDLGYWISYDYQLWNPSFVERFPKYGYDYQYSPDFATQEFPLYFPVVASGSGTPYKLPSLFGVATTNKYEVYHLSKIRTSSHTALFIRDIRKDEKGSIDAFKTTSSSLPSPDLLLKRIMVFKNEQIDSILQLPCTGCPAKFIPSNNPEFDFSNVQTNGNFYTENWYNGRFPSNNHCVLKQIVFDQDYSLCKKYHGNTEVNCYNSSVLTAPTVVQTSLSIGNVSTSGKLTLNRILTYDFKNQKIIPSTIFDYDCNNLQSTLSNPDYHPLKMDYWGYYKSDATTNAYSRYTNTTSKANTKAWSLIKITDPLGGITEMEYESNSYNRVLDNQSPNGVRGAAFIYRIKSVSDINGMVNNSPSISYVVSMEEANSNTNSLSELSYINPSPNCIKRICMPYFQNVCTGGASCVTPYVASFFKGFQFGDCELNFNYTLNNVSGTITAIPQVGQRGVIAFSTPPISKYYQPSGTAGGYAIQSTPAAYSTTGPAYSGNGYILIQTAIGFNVFGGGVRVKTLKTKNNSNEVYVKEYTYEDGVATNEMDRFAYPRFKRYAAQVTPRYGFLEPKTFDRFEMTPYIGYTKVTVRDLGRINSDNGRIETLFVTTPAQVAPALQKNFSVKTVANSNNTGILTFTTINESSNIFGNVFGATLETKVYDKNNNLLTKSVNEYTTTQQGALTEVFYFENPFAGTEYPNNTYAIYSNIVNIIRSIPIVLKSTSTYGMGTFEKTETIARDELTGETTSIRSTGKNNSSSISYKYPAYKHYHLIEGVDYSNPQSRKIFPLGHEMYSYANVDTTLTTNSFLSAAYKLYSKNIKQRVYNGSVFTTTTVTLPYYFNNRSFVFDGGPGSMNDFGLLDKSKLNANPLNLTTINNSVYWEPTATYNWKLMSETTLMDNYKNLVETRDANNRFNACRYGYNGYYKTASASNSNYASFTFADFETAAPNSGLATIDGDIQVNNHSLVTGITPHTGAKCIAVSSTPIKFISASELSPNSTFEIGLMSGRIYRASVWTHSTNLSNAAITVTVSGALTVSPFTSITNTYAATSASNLVTSIGNWNLIQMDFAIPENFSTSTGMFKIELKSLNSGTVYFDDFIFHPVESDFSANVYNPRNGRLMSVLDENGLATNYFYDAAGRVIEVWKEIPSVGYKKIKRNTYNYARGANN